jgi:hypothetical protein
VDVVPSIKIQLRGQLGVLSVPNLQVQMSRAKKMPAKSVEHNPGRAMLGNLVRRRNNRSDLERAIGTRIEATTQVPFWDVRVDIRVKAIGVCYSLAEKITPICADFLVERRGFELMVVAA